MNIPLPKQLVHPGHLFVVVTGGRTYNGFQHLYAILDAALVAAVERQLLLAIVQGGAQGADQIARQWAWHNNVRMITERAQWNVYGKGAGPKRNQAMIDKYHPDICIAMPGGRGTADMVARCCTAGIPVIGHASH